MCSIGLDVHKGIIGYCEKDGSQLALQVAQQEGQTGCC